LPFSRVGRFVPAGFQRLAPQRRTTLLPSPEGDLVDVQLSENMLYVESRAIGHLVAAARGFWMHGLCKLGFKKRLLLSAIPLHQFRDELPATELVPPVALPVPKSTRVDPELFGSGHYVEPGSFRGFVPSRLPTCRRGWREGVRHGRYLFRRPHGKKKGR